MLLNCQISSVMWVNMSARPLQSKQFSVQIWEMEADMRSTRASFARVKLEKTRLCRCSPTTTWKHTVT